MKTFPVYFNETFFSKKFPDLQLEHVVKGLDGSVVENPYYFGFLSEELDPEMKHVFVGKSVEDVEKKYKHFIDAPKRAKKAFKEE